ARGRALAARQYRLTSRLLPRLCALRSAADRFLCSHVHCTSRREASNWTLHCSSRSRVVPDTYICDRKIDIARPLIFSTQGRCRQSSSVTSCEWLLSSSKTFAYEATNCRSSTLRFASSFNDIERLSRLAEPKEAQQSSTSRYLQWNR